MSTTSTVEELWADFAGRMRNFIRSRVRHHADSEDILQEVFLKIHRNLPSLRADQKMEAWVWRIVRHAIADHFRDQRTGDPLLHDVEPATERSADLPDLACCLREFVDQLTPAHRDALRLTDWEGLTQADLARHLGLSISGTKSRIQRARAALKSRLDACCRFELDRRGTLIEATPREPACEDECGD
ncbi:MAG: sigma-70 family RNA polymerase sigma factor [Verrucomicrobiae bacterium]|nr:sigma-70 family RNA polymerase sigma factor [Verrucomicrobiae bacterium]